MTVDAGSLPELRMSLPAPEVEAQTAVALLLSDRSRAAIMAMLRDGPHCVCEMSAALGERSNNVSNHLARLREAGLVRASRATGDTRRVYYERDEAACVAALAGLTSVLGEGAGSSAWSR